MKDISAITKSKRQEYIYWQSILYQFSIDPPTTIIAFPSEKEEDVTIVVIDNNATEYLIDEEQVCLFGFKNSTRMEKFGTLFLATVTEKDYKRFKSNPKLINNVNFDDSIEITINDIPTAYKLLQ